MCLDFFNVLKSKRKLLFHFVMQGSSAGAGSGEFHVYRATRRREYNRTAYIEKKAEEVQEDINCRTVYLIINPLHPNINMHILHTVLYKCPKVLIRRICLTIYSFFGW